MKSGENGPTITLRVWEKGEPVNESDKVVPKTRKYPMFIEPCEHVPKTHPAAERLCYLCSHSSRQCYTRLYVYVGVHWG